VCAWQAWRLFACVCLASAVFVCHGGRLVGGCHGTLLQVGDEGAVEVARHSEADAVVTGIVGCAGLLPTVAAIKAKKEICLANKETLIAGARGRVRA